MKRKRSKAKGWDLKFGTALPSGGLGNSEAHIHGAMYKVIAQLTGCIPVYRILSFLLLLLSLIHSIAWAMKS